MKNGFQYKKKYFIKIVRKSFVLHDRKTIYNFWRDLNFNFNHGTRHKNWEFIREGNKIELIPFKNIINSSLIWLYAGDFPEQIIYHLLEYDSFLTNDMKLTVLRAPFNPQEYNTCVIENNWFNILSFPNSDGRRHINSKLINRYTNQVIFPEIKKQAEIVGDVAKVFIGGFSQGGCMAIHSGLTYEENVAGILSFCGFKFDFTEPYSENKLELPILAINGADDPYVITRHLLDSFKTIKHFKNLKMITENGLFHSFTKSSLDMAQSYFINTIQKSEIKVKI